MRSGITEECWDPGLFRYRGKHSRHFSPQESPQALSEPVARDKAESQHAHYMRMQETCTQPVHALVRTACLAACVF